MSTPPPTSVPAGWYPEPDGGGRLRWWDGAQWTDQVHQAGGAPVAAPAGTGWRTPWIWPVLLLPLVPLIPLLFLDWASLVRIDPVTQQQDPYAQFELLTSPAYLAFLVGSWLVWILVVVLAYLDWRDLDRRGVPAPFHWGWAFLGATVYGIGRGVVTRRRTGAGAAVLWVAIAVLVVSIAVGIGITVGVTAAVFSQLRYS